MDQDRQEPEERMAVDGQGASPFGKLASHTTLRSLFVATAAVAVWAGLWRVWPPVLVYWLITPCAFGFASGVLGAGLTTGFMFGFLAAISVRADFITTDGSWNADWASMIIGAFAEGLARMWLWGLTCFTAVWWGLYFRYAWSNPVWPPASHISGERRFTFREQLLLRCAESRGEFVLVSILAHLFVYTALWWVFVVAGRC